MKQRLPHSPYDHSRMVRRRFYYARYLHLKAPGSGGRWGDDAMWQLLLMDIYKGQMPEMPTPIIADIVKICFRHRGELNSGFVAVINKEPGWMDDPERILLYLLDAKVITVVSPIDPLTWTGPTWVAPMLRQLPATIHT